MDSTTFNIMLSVEILTVRRGRRRQHLLGSAGRRGRADAAAGVPAHAARMAASCCRWRGPNFYPMNRIYDFLHGFLDFENAKRLIAYGLILIVMMIVRPDGLLTRDSLRRLSFQRWKARHA